MLKKIGIVTALLATLLPAAPVLAKGVTPFYDYQGEAEPRGSFFCGGPPTTWSKLPIVGTVGRVVAGKGYVAGVSVRKTSRSAGLKQARVSYSVRVDGGVRLPEREYIIGDLSARNLRATRNFRVSVLEKNTTLAGTGSRFDSEGVATFRAAKPGTGYFQGEWELSSTIRVECATPEDLDDNNGQTQLSADLETTLKLLQVRSRGRIFRSN